MLSLVLTSTGSNLGHEKSARGKSLLEFSSRLTATLNLCLIYFKSIWALDILLEHMHKKFEINRTKIKGGCQSRRKVVPHDSKSDLPLTSQQRKWLGFAKMWMSGRNSIFTNFFCVWVCDFNFFKHFAMKDRIVFGSMTASKSLIFFYVPT